MGGDAVELDVPSADPPNSFASTSRIGSTPSIEPSASQIAGVVAEEQGRLDLRFGLTGNGTHSLRQIGHLLRISKERVRQIQNRALEKLKANAERVGWEPTLLLE